MSEEKIAFNTIILGDDDDGDSVNTELKDLAYRCLNLENIQYLNTNTNTEEKKFTNLYLFYSSTASNSPIKFDIIKISKLQFTKNDDSSIIIDISYNDLGAASDSINKNTVLNVKDKIIFNNVSIKKGFLIQAKKENENEKDLEKFIEYLKKDLLNNLAANKENIIKSIIYKINKKKPDQVVISENDINLFLKLLSYNKEEKKMYYSNNDPSKKRDVTEPFKDLANRIRIFRYFNQNQINESINKEINKLMSGGATNILDTADLITLTNIYDKLSNILFLNTNTTEPFETNLKSSFNGVAIDALLQNEYFKKYSNDLLPEKIKTDSYTFKQIIENYSELETESLKIINDYLYSSLFNQQLKENVEIYIIKLLEPIFALFIKNYKKQAATATSEASDASAATASDATSEASDASKTKEELNTLKETLVESFIETYKYLIPNYSNVTVIYSIKTKIKSYIV